MATLARRLRTACVHPGDTGRLTADLSSVLGRAFGPALSFRTCAKLRRSSMGSLGALQQPLAPGRRSSDAFALVAGG